MSILIGGCAACFDLLMFALGFETDLQMTAQQKEGVGPLPRGSHHYPPPQAAASSVPAVRA